jgi:hypothetical protein
MRHDRKSPSKALFKLRQSIDCVYGEATDSIACNSANKRRYGRARVMAGRALVFTPFFPETPWSRMVAVKVMISTTRWGLSCEQVYLLFWVAFFLSRLLPSPSNETSVAVTVREVKLAASAQFIVMICGDIMTMPGLPKVPSAEKIDMDEEGSVVGLF